MHHKSSMIREVGTAFAVLALYLLTVLTPLHEARASQLAFAQLGYTTTQTSWALCGAPAAPGGSQDTGGLAKCPATGVGKTALALPILDVVPVAHDFALAAPRFALLPAFAGRALAPSGGPRAPPLLR